MNSRTPPEVTVTLDHDGGTIVENVEAMDTVRSQIEEYIEKAELSDAPADMIILFTLNDSNVMEMTILINGNRSTIFVGNYEDNPLNSQPVGSYYSTYGEDDGTDVIMVDEIQEVEQPSCIIVPTSQVMTRFMSWVDDSVDPRMWRDKPYR